MWSTLGRWKAESKLESLSAFEHRTLDWKSSTSTTREWVPGSPVVKNKLLPPSGSAVLRQLNHINKTAATKFEVISMFSQSWYKHGMKQVKEDILLIFHGRTAESGMFLFLVNFNILLSWNNVASHKKWQKFMFEVILNLIKHLKSTCFSPKFY